VNVTAPRQLGAAPGDGAAGGGADPAVTLDDAMAAAMRLFAGRVDKSGAPSILHALRVMRAVGTERERIAAVLHEVPADRGWDALRASLGEVPPWLTQALDALTRRRPDGESYEAYIARAAGDPVARAVKIADLRDNLDPRRIPDPPTPRDERRCAKYRRALAALGAS
jgi:(p)ppGpp synthase/HD superfamily hydrolase